jgi:thiol-disulfide isomerase/thioredoxin
LSNKYQKSNKGVQAQGITMSILILSIILSFVLGIITGFFVGENRAESRLSNLVLNNNTGNQNNQNDQTPEPTEDFSKYVINEAKNITIDNFYQDAETKSYAKNLIGKEMPRLTWKDSDGIEHSTDEYGDKYIVELFGTNCPYCISTVPEVDKFREANPDIKIVALTPDSYEPGGLDQFNQAGEHSFYWELKDAGSDLLMSNMPWVPGFIFVQNGQIKLVSFGGTDVATLEGYADIAFQ